MKRFSIFDSNKAENREFGEKNEYIRLRDIRQRIYKFSIN